MNNIGVYADGGANVTVGGSVVGHQVVVGADVEGPEPQPVWHVARQQWGRVVCYLNPDEAEVIFDGTRHSVRVSVDQLKHWDEVVT